MTTFLFITVFGTEVWTYFFIKRSYWIGISRSPSWELLRNLFYRNSFSPYFKMIHIAQTVAYTSIIFYKKYLNVIVMLL